MKKLNKSQHKFFQEAVNKFGSNPTRKKDLQSLADGIKVRLPVTVLKALCKSKVRGRYDVSKAGVERFDPVIDAMETPVDVAEVMAEQVSVKDGGDDEYIQKPKKKTKQRKKPSKLTFKYEWKNPVYLVMFRNHRIINSVRMVKQSFESAWKARKNLLCDHGNMSFKEAQKIIEKVGEVKIRSTNSYLFCVIQKMELES